METEVKIYRCGNCGNPTHNLYKRKNDDIIVECTECKSTSIISASQPKLNIEFGDDSEGRIAIFD